jgi:plasmid stabilization system protein ParE
VSSSSPTNYLILYHELPDAGRVEILRILNGARELEALFGK